MRKLVPASLDKVLLVNTGGEANEVAPRLAKMYTGRFEIVGLTRSWHGLQAGVASLNLAAGHAGYSPLMPIGARYATATVLVIALVWKLASI